MFRLMIMGNKLKGYIFGFIAAVTYGMNPLFALPLLRGGMDASAVLFYRYLLAVPMIAVIMFFRHSSFKVSGKEMLLLVVFGILMGISSLTLFESYGYMNAGIASTILFVYPLMVAVIMALFFKEKMTVVTISALVLATVGIAMLYKGEGGATLSLVGTMLVMASALSYAFYIVGVKHTPIKNVPTLTVTFYVLLYGMMIFLFNLLFKGGMSVPHGALQWGSAMGLALFPTAISFLCTTRAIALIGSTPTAILGAMEPVTAVLIGLAVFSESLTARDVSGILMIIVAVMLVILFNGRRASFRPHRRRR